MSNEANVPEESAIVEVESEEIVVKEKTDNVPQETMALIEAIKRKAQSETQKAGEFTREKYLEGVRKARIEIEKLNFSPEQVETSIKQIQSEVEKDWDGLLKEVKSFGDRLSDAAKAAWDALTAPRSKSE
ncbi:MAG: hypothetical protein DSM107014_02360 [Gomphosphaeria aponina SAG 52.96 = DSM 107014]|uniref:Uncharacterized protein n=1 Tax=Gomphosphaeria aponina SAG 52.96 = DSM 107014 TaxID=1521640 RepID=A0A941GTF8_9CHRO|nr:hypothetical protein [Gomphosphaeria aponina SAG 52.96 = DSM 107014]